MAAGRGSPRTGLAIGLTAITAMDLAAALVLIVLAGDRAAQVSSIRLGEALALVVPWMAFSIVGVVIVRHRPGNTVGWLCSIAGVGVSVVALSVGIATLALATDRSEPIGTTAAWVAHTGSITIVAFPLLIMYRFPTGRPLGQGWRRIEALTVAYVVSLILLVAVDPMPMLGFPATPNPFGIGAASRLSALIFVPATAGAVLAMSSLVVRFRQGSALERRQLRLLAAASALVGVAMGTMTVTSPDLVTTGRLSTLTAAINAIAFAAIPVAIGIAIVRDRLYDIDRIVNRTLVYAVVSAVLAAVYGVTVIGLSAPLGVLAPGVGSTIATAGSTLLVAALFRPVRARAQGAIDRRFDRERYEAAQSIESFAGQVRAEVELEPIVADLARAADGAVRPSTMSCWIRGSVTGDGS